MQEQVVLDTKSGLDWLTVTSTAWNSGNVLLDIYSSHKVGNDRSTPLYGFECLRDEEGLTWGRRPMDGRYILIAPGEVAQKIFLKLAPLPVKVTRIDLACDVWLTTPRDQVTQSARVPLSPAHDSRIKATLVTGRKGTTREKAGDTLYLGARQSTQFGRMYDKGLQQRTQPAGKWFRYEVEYKAAAARQIATQARELLPLQFGEWVRCTVYDWFLARAVAPLFCPKTNTSGTVVRSQFKQSTKTKKLTWLRTQVKPTVQYLFEQGLKNETLAALGVDLVRIVDTEYNNISGQSRSEEIDIAA